jgi:plastocyanin
MGVFDSFDSDQVGTAKRLFIFEQELRLIGQKKTTMKITKLITTIAVSAGLAYGVAAQAKEKHEEESISSTDVPAAVQKAAETEAKGGKIVRWEKEGADYEAVIDKNGKEWGFKFDANGKLLGKHDESKEKGEKY